MKMKIIGFIALFLLLLVTGVFWGTWFALSLSIDEFSAAEFIHIGKVIIANVGVPMSIIMPLCILFMFLFSIFYPTKKSLGFYFSLTALILIIITLLLTVLILVPIDNQIKHWMLSTIPSDWANIRKSWEFYHSLRTFTSLASFACFALAIMNNEKTN
jgi:uncharacterized membrane protein